jgi:hypothetical protein
MRAPDLKTFSAAEMGAFAGPARPLADGAAHAITPGESLLAEAPRLP